MSYNMPILERNSAKILQKANVEIEIHITKYNVISIIKAQNFCKEK
jgi:hypothetical protein